ncbi:MAG TPA: threonine synthase [Blastocatellia bacterium]|nr:threonine synthase [Blastocatellia bacterium]HMX29781.1 threonine synthase [Blastocatellia bacterium]HMZ21594.1 threonine synthase [Blastocatellia bacterium]HNG31209.1 threonine synthase [Blastocatellia bacterium]
MNNITGFQCLECARAFGVNEIKYVCPECGGNLDVRYDYERINQHFSKASLAADRNFTIWRYRPLLPIEDASPVPPLNVGWTPLYDAPRLADEFGVRQVLIKDDGRNPTASFKDRPSALAVIKAQEAGATVATTASSGNAGAALAGMCASVGMKSVIFVPATTPAAKVAQLQIYGATVVLVEGSYEQACELCLAASERFGWYQRTTGYNAFTAEGKKTAAFEIAEQLNWQVPDRVIVGVGDGNIIGGLWKGFYDLQQLGWIDRIPKLTGVQAAGAAPLVAAVNGDGVIRPVEGKTIADGINVGDPRDGTRALRAMRDSGGGAIAVSDEDIIASIPRLACATGVFAEPGAAAAFAGFIKLREQCLIQSNESVALVITGSGLKDINTARRSVEEPLRIRPDLTELIALPGALP